jgi:hypothetical protein
MRTNASELGFHGVHIATFHRLSNVLQSHMGQWIERVTESNISRANCRPQFQLQLSSS